VPERVENAPGVQTRRARRAAEVTAETAADTRVAKTHPTHWIPRIALLCTLAGITVVLPLTDNVSPGNGTFVAGASAAEAPLPGTIEALGGAVGTAPPAAIAASVATSTAAERAEIRANRSEVRDPLPGCAGQPRSMGANGQLKQSDLCTLWDGTNKLRGDAASSLAELNLAFKARFGHDLCISNGYRTIAEQRVLKSEKGGLAALPGRSNHGWGLAVDLCPTETSGRSYDWIKENAAIYGWENPAWALPGGSGPYEVWHWEYTRGVMASGEHYNS